MWFPLLNVGTLMWEDAVPLLVKLVTALLEIHL